MEEKFITKEDKVLTRVSLKIENGKTYIVESIYSDEDILELGISCIEAFVSEQGMTREDLALNIDKILKKEKRFISSTHTKFSFIFEQYGNRKIISSEYWMNDIEALISAFESCAVLSGWNIEVVEKFLKKYVDENTDIEEEELNKE